MKKILVILDGAADLGVDVFGGKTPLEKAHTPNMDFLARNGKQGIMYPIDERTIPGSDNSLLSLFGNACKVGRGLLETIGLGVHVKKGDLTFRINFGTIDNIKNKVVIDRRAGRTLTTSEAQELVNSLNKKIKLSCGFEFKEGIQHRAVLVLRRKHSDKITGNDTEWTIPGKKQKTFQYSRPLDGSDENARRTADVVNDLIDQVFKILNNHPINLERKRKGLLPANMVFLRGPEAEIPKLKQYKDWMAINSMPLEVGISKLLGMKNFSFGYPKLKTIDVYDNLYKALDKKMKFAKQVIKKNHKKFNGCYIQFKETDVPGHDNKPLEKKHMLEVIDKNFIGFIGEMAIKHKWKVVITCDHSTPCRLKGHSSDPVPVLVYGDGKDETRNFCEKQAGKGSLGKIYGREFMGKVGLG
jgi:2,3-bisphosphoglycerate-independent phosphoglycerate mutase